MVGTAGLTYTAKRTVIAGQRRYAHGDTIPGDALSEKDAERLLDLGAIQKVAVEVPTPPAAIVDPGPGAVTDASAAQDLRAKVADAVRALGAADYTSGGKPKVEAIEARLPDLKGQIDAALRDDVFGAMQAEGFSAPK